MRCKTCNQEKIKVASGDGTLLAEYCTICDPVPKFESNTTPLFKLFVYAFLIFLAGISFQLGQNVVDFFWYGL